MEKRFFIFLLLVFACILSWCGFIAYLDPFQQFRISNNPTTNAFIMRPRSAGIAKNYPHNISIIGASTVFKILSTDIESVFPGTAANLALSGSSNYEERAIVNLAIKNNHITHIIWGLHSPSCTHPLNFAREQLDSYTSDLNFSTFFAYCFNRELAKGIFNGKCPTQDKTWVKFNNYITRKSKKNEDPISIESFKTGSNNAGIALSYAKEMDLGLMKENFNRSLQIIKSNPEVQFILFFPPVYEAWWVLIEAGAGGFCTTYLDFKEYIYQECRKYPNIRLYDFQADRTIISNPSNFFDLVHYDKEIGHKIAIELNGEKYLANPDETVFRQFIKELNAENREKYHDLINNDYIQSLINPQGK